jgi:transcriptional regulator with XRE-family HTH domain
MITIEQSRAARGLLGWTQQDLADASGLSKTAINNFEKKHSDIKSESLRAIRMAFESVGIEFIGEDGLKKRSDTVDILRGAQALETLIDDIIYDFKNNDENMVFVLHATQRHFDALSALRDKDIPCRMLCYEGTQTGANPPEFYRWLPERISNAGPTTFMYGSKVAFELWDGASIVLIESTDSRRAEQQRFENLWNSLSASTENSVETQAI